MFDAKAEFAEPGTMIQVENLSIAFDSGAVPVLERLSFSLDQGDSLAIIGPSGCGKTTLLYILAGLLPFTQGKVRIRGNDKVVPGDGSAIILQDYGLFPWKTVFQNVVLALQVRKAPENVQAETTRELLNELGIANIADRYPVQISGGQKQRVAIARSLAASPDLLLMDEPFSSLDAMTRESLQNTILDMSFRRRLTFVIVTHSVEEAVFLGKRIMVLSDRPTRIKAMLSSQGVGNPDYRLSDDFFDLVRRIRLIMADPDRTSPPHIEDGVRS